MTKMAETPSRLFGPLFAAVQVSGLFSDSKYFADARPRRAPAAILKDWEVQKPEGEEAL